MEQEAEAARKTLGLQTEEDKKRAQFADELERKRHVDQVGARSPHAAAAAAVRAVLGKEIWHTSYICSNEMIDGRLSYFSIIRDLYHTRKHASSTPPPRKRGEALGGRGGGVCLGMMGGGVLNRCLPLVM